MQRPAAAIETIERVVEMSRSAGLRNLEANALNHLASLYEKAGRVKEAETSKESAKEVWSKIERVRAPAGPPRPPVTIPAQWIDLPGAPAAAEYRVLNGENQAVLVNRSTKGIRMVSFGCVALEDNKKARVLYNLTGIGVGHGAVPPTSHFQPFDALNGPMNRWTDEKMGCEGAAKMTLIEAQFEDNTTWKAEGSDWQR